MANSTVSILKSFTLANRYRYLPFVGCLGHANIKAQNIRNDQIVRFHPQNFWHPLTEQLALLSVEIHKILFLKKIFTEKQISQVHR